MNEIVIPFLNGHKFDNIRISKYYILEQAPIELSMSGGKGKPPKQITIESGLCPECELSIMHPITGKIEFRFYYNDESTTEVFRILKLIDRTKTT